MILEWCSILCTVIMWSLPLEIGDLLDQGSASSTFVDINVRILQSMIELADDGPVVIFVILSSQYVTVFFAVGNFSSYTLLFIGSDGVSILTEMSDMI